MEDRVYVTRNYRLIMCQPGMLYIVLTVCWSHKPRKDVSRAALVDDTPEKSLLVATGL